MKNKIKCKVKNKKGEKASAVAKVELNRKLRNVGNRSEWGLFISLLLAGYVFRIKDKDDQIKESNENEERLFPMHKAKFLLCSRCRNFSIENGIAKRIRFSIRRLVGIISCLALSHEYTSLSAHEYTHIQPPTHTGFGEQICRCNAVQSVVQCIGGCSCGKR